MKICKTSAKKQKMWNIFWRMISVPRLRSKSKKNCNEKYYSAFTSSRKAPVISWTKVVWEEISSATTANPRLCSQARVVSMEAFRDNRLVWDAISSISEMILPILLEVSLILAIASTIAFISALLLSASFAYFLACS